MTGQQCVQRLGPILQLFSAELAPLTVAHLAPLMHEVQAGPSLFGTAVLKKKKVVDEFTDAKLNAAKTKQRTCLFVRCIGCCGRNEGSKEKKEKKKKLLFDMFDSISY